MEAITNRFVDSISFCASARRSLDMKHKWKVGSWFGTGVYLHWTFLAFLAWVFLFSGGIAGALFMLAIFACVVAHEYGHVLMARRYGIGTRDITLYPIGGVAALHSLPKKPGEEIAVALAGPAVNIAIASILGSGLLITGQWSLDMATPGGFFSTVVFANLFLAGFNLLPAFPMDGGRVLRAWLARRYDYATATDKAAKVGRVFAGIFALLAIIGSAPMFLVLAAFVYLAAGAERRQAFMEREGSPLGWVFRSPTTPSDAPRPRWRNGDIIDVEVVPPPPNGRR